MSYKPIDYGARGHNVSSGPDRSSTTRRVLTNTQGTADGFGYTIVDEFKAPPSAGFCFTLNGRFDHSERPVMLRRAAFQKQPDETGIVKNMKGDWRVQVIVTITEKAEYHAWHKYRN